MKIKKQQIFKLQFGMFFKATREDNNLKQTEFAKLLGITQGSVSKIESGKMIIDLQTYLKFKKEFKVTDYQWENL
jgi:transcriptional regulator with XRE-family HTH domain